MSAGDAPHRPDRGRHRGWGWSLCLCLQVTHLSDHMRITRGNRGGIFVHLRPALLTRAAILKGRDLRLREFKKESGAYDEELEVIP